MSDGFKKRTFSPLLFFFIFVQENTFRIQVDAMKIFPLVANRQVIHSPTQLMGRVDGIVDVLVVGQRVPVTNQIPTVSFQGLVELGLVVLAGESRHLATAIVVNAEVGDEIGVD